jgi:hypothetical protein
VANVFGAPTLSDRNVPKSKSILSIRPVIHLTEVDGPQTLSIPRTLDVFELSNCMPDGLKKKGVNRQLPKRCRN